MWKTENLEKSDKYVKEDKDKLYDIVKKDLIK